MNASVPRTRLVWLWLAVLLAGCASRKAKPHPASPPPPANRVGSMAVTNGIKVLASIGLPPGFVPDLAYGPIWMARGKLVAIAGTANGRSGLIGYSGPGFATQLVIAADDGAGAPQGVILGADASPDAAALALVVASPQRGNLAIRIGAGDGGWRTVAEIPGVYSGAQVKWLNARTIALILRSDPPTINPSDPTGPGNGAQVVIIKLGDPVTTNALTKIQCAFASLNFSPDGRWAVGQGDPNTPPALLDLDNEVCSPIDRSDPIRVLSWRPDGLAFLYVAPGPTGVPGVFRYDHASGVSSLVAIASGAAAYASDGSTIAIGNEQLTWRSASSGSTKPIVAQIALFPPGDGSITVNSLGFETTPELLARTSMLFAPSVNTGLIDIAAVKTMEPLRELIEYSYSGRAAFALAALPPDASIAASWSPDNKLIAFIDTGARPPRLTIIAPPR